MPIQEPTARVSFINLRRTEVLLPKKLADSTMKLSLALLALGVTVGAGQHSMYQPHYLVGLLNYPNSFVPDALQGHTSGTYIDPEASNGVPVPFSDVPGVGFSDMEMYYNEEGNSVPGQYFVLSDNGKL